MAHLWAGLVSENWGQEGREYLRGFVALVISSPAHWVASWCTYRCHSDAIYFPPSFQLWPSFVFPSSVPAYSGNLSRFFMESSYLLPPSVYFFCVFHLIRSSLFASAGFLLCLLRYLHVGMDHSDDVRSCSWGSTSCPEALCLSEQSPMGSCQEDP